MLPLAPRARLHILHVLPRDLPAKARPKLVAEARKVLEETVTAARAEAHRRGVEELEVTSALLFGEPFVEIIRTSRTIEAELIVEWVIDAAPCDVLVARPTRFSFELP